MIAAGSSSKTLVPPPHPTAILTAVQCQQRTLDVYWTTDRTRMHRDRVRNESTHTHTHAHARTHSLLFRARQECQLLRSACLTISQNRIPNFTKFYFMLPVAVSRSDTLCTSGLVDDVVFTWTVIGDAHIANAWSKGITVRDGVDGRSKRCNA